MKPDDLCVNPCWLMIQTNKNVNISEINVSGVLEIRDVFEIGL